MSCMDTFYVERVMHASEDLSTVELSSIISSWTREVFLSLSSKCFLIRTISTGTHQVFPPVLQVLFYVKIPTGTHQVFAPSSMFFIRANCYQNRSSICPVLHVFPTYKLLSEQIKYLPLSSKSISSYNFYQKRSSISPCPPSSFRHTIPTRTDQVFAPIL